MGAGVGFFGAAVNRKRDWEHHGHGKAHKAVTKIHGSNIIAITLKPYATLRPYKP